MNIALRSIGMIGIGIIATTMVVSPSVSKADNATQFMNGGEYCFLIGETLPGGWVTKLKMVVSRVRRFSIGYVRNPAPSNIAHVDAVEHGTKATNPPRSYVTPLTGSATIGSQLGGDNEIQISLTGSNFGEEDTPGITGLWISDQAIRLNLVDLTGHDTGYKSFTPIEAGEPGETIRSAVDKAVTPISCSDF